MLRTSICLFGFAFALAADFFTGPFASELTRMEETASAALAFGPLAFVAYRWYAGAGQDNKDADKELL